MTTTTVTKFHAGNCRSFLQIARYWITQRIWDRAIDALKAALRSARKAHLTETEGICFSAIRDCQNEQRWERLDVPEHLRGTVDAAGMQ